MYFWGLARGFSGVPCGEASGPANDETAHTLTARSERTRVEKLTILGNWFAAMVASQCPVS